MAMNHSELHIVLGAFSAINICRSIAPVPGKEVALNKAGTGVQKQQPVDLPVLRKALTFHVPSELSALVELESKPSSAVATARTAS